MSKKTLHEQAVADVAELRKVAFENAKNVLVEAIVPKIKEMIEGELGENQLAIEMGAPDAEDEKMLPPEAEAAAMMGMGMPAGTGMPPLVQVANPGVYEVEDEEAPLDLDLPKLKGDGDDEEAEEKDDEKGDEDKDMDEVKLGEAKDADEEKKDDAVDEVVRISEDDLREAFKSVLKSELSEAAVTKSFGDVKTAEEGGIADKKSGEHQWADEEAPASQDWTVKEAKAYVAKASKANRALKTENEQLRKAYSLLKQNLSEVHLFNSKLLHAQKLIRKNGLSGAKSNAVIEAFDRANSVREVELIYRSLSESLTKIAGVVTEARDIKAAKASRTVKPSSTLLQEGAANEGNSQYDRWATLAGIVK